MKTISTLLVAFLISLSSFAQTGINYKAIIKDDLGNVVASQPVTVQFIIYEGSALTNNVYQESHPANTDANGIAIVNIGQGTTTDVFTDIDWGSDEHWLNVQVDTGSGLVDMGTTQFMAVPYAKNAETAKNVTGLEKISENNQNGWRLKNQNSNNYGDIGAFAVDLSISLNPSTSLGATGNFSAALGGDTKASGDISFASGNLTHALGLVSTAMGRETEAQGDFSTATGLLSRAIGNTSFAMGFDTRANGYDAVSMGNNTKADANASLVIGRYNVGGGNATTWLSNDPLFEIGIGTNTNSRKNALTVQKNGLIGVGTNSPQHQFEIYSEFGGNNALSIESTNQPFGKDLVELKVPAGSDNGSQFIEMENGNTVVAAVNSDGSAKFKSIQFEDNTVQTTAALVPIAYGAVNSDGIIIQGSGNFTVTWNTISESYRIAIAGETNTQWYSYMTVVNSAFAFSTKIPSTGMIGPGTVEVTFRDSNGMATQNIFTFITYKIN